MATNICIETLKDNLVQILALYVAKWTLRVMTLYEIADKQKALYKY
jgi:hypothetical protein